MTTHEDELTLPVDLCTPDGVHLNPAALGWSRVPLHRANLDGLPGRNKRWDYWCIQAGDLVVSAVYADIDVIGLADVYWVDLASGAAGGRSIIAAPDAGIHLPQRCGAAPLSVDHDGLALRLTDDPSATRIEATWTEADGRPGRLSAEIGRPEGLESVNVVIPWSDDEFNFTSKQWARPVVGQLSVGERTWVLDAAPDGAWGALDVGRGRWPSVIRWNWGGGHGSTDGHVVGVQFGAKWTEGTGFTENGIVVDGRVSKIGRELTWDYDWDRPLDPWTVTDPDGQIELVLTPRFDKHGALGDLGTGDGDLGSETHQVFGTWSGRIVTDDGIEVAVDGLQGFAEEARQHW